MLTSTTLASLMGNTISQGEYDRLLPHFLHAADIAHINTPKRMAMWVAQLGHESVGLKYMEEIASGADYEGRRDLGNTQPGDGKRFKGRGPIQLTGRANYRAFTEWARRSGVSTLNFEAEPKLLENPHWGFIAAAYYWVVARPQLNNYSDLGDVVAATRAINGGTIGLDDRIQRYQRALSLLTDRKPVEKVLHFDRAGISQDTYYNCGPASCQTIIKSATGVSYRETELGAALRTHTGGTDYIGQFPAVLNRYIKGAEYRHRDLPSYPNHEQKEQLWRDVVGSVSAGHGVVANIVAPPSNYPKATLPSTISPAYAGGTVYHYIAIMGYAEDHRGRRVWVADSGFSPFVYWLKFDQLATLIPPKGYAYSTTKTQPSDEEELMNALNEVHKSIVPDSEYKAPLKQMIVNADGHAYVSRANTEKLLTLVADLATEVKALREQVNKLSS